jgi:SAM-dependent methyltransferase
MDGKLDALARQLVRQGEEAQQREAALHALMKAERDAGYTSADIARQLCAEAELLRERDAHLPGEMDALRSQLLAIENSTIWQATWPIRRVLASIPPGVRRTMRRGFKVALRAATLPSRLAQPRLAVPTVAPRIAHDPVGGRSNAPVQPRPLARIQSTIMLPEHLPSAASPGRWVAPLNQAGDGALVPGEPARRHGSETRQRSVSDEAWLEMVIAAAEGRPPAGQHLPPFPDPEWQAKFVGSSNAQAMREAFSFYTLLKGLMESNGTPIGSETRALDFGCGWGRYIRLMMKDIGAEALYGADVDPDMIGFCRISGLPAKFAVMPPLGPTEYPDGNFDLIFAYSVFSHLSKDAHGVWMQEFARILRPGGLLVFTTQARRFLEWTAELREKPEADLTEWEKSLRFAFPDLDQVLIDYDAGQFIFAPTGGGEYRPSSFYGEAAISEGYLRRDPPDGLSLQGFIDDAGRCPQAVAILRRVT